jgi:hypothetical protein
MITLAGAPSVPQKGNCKIGTQTPQRKRKQTPEVELADNLDLSERSSGIDGYTQGMDNSKCSVSAFGTIQGFW